MRLCHPCDEWALAGKCPHPLKCPRMWEPVPVSGSEIKPLGITPERLAANRERWDRAGDEAAARMRRDGR